MAGPIDAKRKGIQSISCWAYNVILTFDNTHGLDHGFSKSNFEKAISQEWEGRLTLNKRDGSRSFMTMTTTFWWPRWGVRIYQIGTGVTSDVCMSLTCLVCFCYIIITWSNITWYCIHHCTVTATEYMYKSEFEPAKDTTKLAVTGELWGVFCENLGQN